MEIIEAYCRTLMIAAQLGKPMNTFTPGQLKELLTIKQSLGFVDPRYGLKECELCDNDEWRPGVSCQIPAKAETTAGLDTQAEAAVQAITDQILARMK
jgi:L-fuculose-phosphate aldolase